MNELLTYAQAGDRLGVHERSIRRIVDAGQLQFVQVTPGCRRIRPQDLDAYIARNTKCLGTGKDTGSTKRRGYGASASPSPASVGAATARALGMSGPSGKSSSTSPTSAGRPSTAPSGARIVSFPTAPVLTTQTGDRYTYSGLHSAWKRACDKAGVKNAHIHDLRRKALTDATNQMGKEAAQALAGHKSPEMTAHYYEHTQEVWVQPVRVK